MVITGRRRKKRVRRVVRVKRVIPSIFQCPHCGVQALTIEINRGKGVAIARCGHCGFMAELNVPPIYQPVDVYGMIIDLYNSGRLEYRVEPVGEEEHEVEGESG